MLIKATNLQLSFGADVIYDNACFLCEKDDKVGIVGVNGAGKTTLFKVLLGQQKLDDGEIELDNPRIAYLPQEIKVSDEFADISVWDYIYQARPIEEIQEKINLEYEKLAKYPNSSKITERINDLQALFDSYDPYKADIAILDIVEKMGLSELVDRKMRELSGGQKSKVAFARTLFENAPVLMLDEPTNHLDVATKNFVINYLRNYNGTVLIISHDQAFLDLVVDKILFLNKTTHKTKIYKGNYSSFRRQRATEMAIQEQKVDQQEREIRRIQEFVERARNAKRSNTALIKQGHVREKMLDRKLAVLEVREKEYQKININVSPKSQSAKMPLELQKLSFHYPGVDKLLYSDLSFTLTRGDKFLIVGENGIGKSTLLKLIVGQLQPTSGSIIFGNKVDIAYYAQELEILDERRTILENVRNYDFTDTELRGVLSNFLFFDDDVNKQVAVLSPGEKARVALCKILLKRANFVILDEPTNHFDPETQKIIGDNFRDYDGTLIMVSHNPSFVEQVGVNRMLILPDGIIKNYSHELLEYYYYLNSDLL